MKKQRKYWVYIMASQSNVLYIGVTNNLSRRVFEHRYGLGKGFTKKYHCQRLVYYEEYESIILAIAREKEIKKWRRQKKENLIIQLNPAGRELLPD